MYVLGQLHYALGLGVASHDGYAGDVAAELADKAVDGSGIKGFAYVLPQILAVAARAVARTIGHIDGERDFVGNLLEDDARIDVLEHRFLPADYLAEA